VVVQAKPRRVLILSALGDLLGMALFAGLTIIQVLRRLGTTALNMTLAFLSRLLAAEEALTLDDMLWENSLRVQRQPKAHPRFFSSPLRHWNVGLDLLMKVIKAAHKANSRCAMIRSTVVVTSPSLQLV
jgi:hypothetical protein